VRLKFSSTKKPPVPLNEGPEVLRTLSPEDLAARAAAGSTASFGELVRRFEVRLFNFLLRKMGSRADAEDLTQEAFVRAWERMKDYDQQWKFSTWLFTIASRLAVSHYRRRRPEVSSGELDRSDTPLPVSADGDIEADRKLGAHLWALAATTLVEDQHEALWLRYAEDLSIPDIAQVMGKSHVSVRVCLFRARQTLAARLKDSEDSRKRHTEADNDRLDSTAMGLSAIASGTRPVAGGMR
jgi:RNA polymerase sigma-70 factor, ECF subfamily